MAIVRLRGATVGTGDIVLRDYADLGSPRTACRMGPNWVAQLIDARHIVISHAAYAVVDLPEVRYHWFKVPGQLLSVGPGLDEVAWLEADVAGDTDKVHITTSAGDRIVGSVPNNHLDRCGDPDDSTPGAYTHSGAHLSFLSQPYPSLNSLLVVDGEAPVLSLVPPGDGWSEGAHPAMPVWSPTSETLFYRHGSDVWRWTPADGPQLYLPGVTWHYPTITPDGRHLAYSVERPDGLHDVYLIDLAHDGSPQRIGKGARNRPAFVNSTQLWLHSEVLGEGCGGIGAETPLIYDLSDGSESPSIIEAVLRAWPATSSNF